MPLGFKFTVKGSERTDAALQIFPIRDWRVVWPRVASGLSRMVADQFAQEGARGPQGPWKPLAVKGQEGPSGPYKTDYAKRKQRQSPGSSILQATGALLRSFLPESGNTVNESWPMKLRWGTSLPYAAYLHRGTRKMYARPIFDFELSEDRKMIEQALRAGANEIFFRAGYKILGTPQSQEEARTADHQPSRSPGGRGTALSAGI